jgi:hypothetical protein
LRAARVAALSNWGAGWVGTGRQRRRAYEREELCGLVLERVGEVVVEEADMAEVDLEHVLLEQEIRAELVAVCAVLETLDKGNE